MTNVAKFLITHTTATPDAKISLRIGEIHYENQPGVYGAVPINPGETVYLVFNTEGDAK